MQTVKNTLTNIVNENSSIQVSSIKDSYESGTLFIDKNYQRNAGAWNELKKSQLILSILENYPLGEIIRNKVEMEVDGMIEERFELVDGQQRITTIIDFMNDKFAMNNDDSHKVVEIFINYFKKSSEKESKKVLGKYDGNEKIRLKYKSLPTYVQNKIKTCLLNIRTFHGADYDYIVEYFRRVQNGSPLKNEDMTHTVVNALTIKTKEISQNEKLLRLFDKYNENGELKKDADRAINSCLLEMIALYCDGRPMGNPKNLWRWVNQSGDSLKMEHNVQIIKVKELISQIDTNNRRLEVGKTELKLIFGLIFFGYESAKKKMNFDYNDFANFIFNVALSSEKIKTHNIKNSTESREIMDNTLKNCGLYNSYYNNVDLFIKFSNLRAGSQNRDDFEKIVYGLITIYKNLNVSVLHNNYVLA